MRAIDKKVLRDVSHMKGQVIAIAAVIGCGIAIFIGWQTTSVSLQKGLDSYYEDQRFADVFTSMNRAPLAIGKRVVEIPGVADVDMRIVESVTLHIEGLSEPGVGRLISLPDRGQSKLNRVRLLEGRMPEYGKVGEIVAEEAFAKANGFTISDSVTAVMNGRLQELRIVGIGISPEFLTTVQSGSPFPDDKRFGILWMRRHEMETAFDMDGATNDLALSLNRGASSEEVILRLDRLLDRYGSLGAYDRERQLSHRFISDELTQLEAMTLIPPSIFLGVAAFLLNVVLRRILSMQRPQIASLKAFGYTNWEVGMHYGKLVGVIVIGGALGGCLFGAKMGQELTDLYVEFYRFPGTVYQTDVMSYVVGIVLSLASGFVGVFGAVSQTMKIQPAEAMRPEPPPDYKLTFFERLGLNRWMSPAFRMVLREILRRPMKASLTTLGIAFGCAVVVVGNFGKDAIDYLVDFQFGLQQRQDVSLNFIEAVPASEISSIKQIRGIRQVETFRSVPVRLRNGQYSRQLGITGLPERRDLFRLLDDQEQVIGLPQSGLMLSSHLAEILHVKVGDEITVEVLEDERPVRKAVVQGCVNDYSGSAAYMNIGELNRFMRESSLISGAYLTLDPLFQDSAFEELKDIPFVGAVYLQRAAYEGFMESFAENLLQFQFINGIFASVIAVGVVYNSARIALSERSRELATLRVIGFTKAEVSGILLGELALLTCIAIPLGWLIGYGMSLAIVMAMPTENFRIPMVLSANTYGFAALVIAVAAVGSGLIVRRGINKLDLVSVLKSNE